MMILSKEIATNVGPIDRQHQLLLALCEMYRVIIAVGLGRDTYARMLSDLSRETSAHFHFEDELMHCQSCLAARDQYRSDDEHVFHELRRYEVRLAENGFSDDDARECLDSFEEWVVSHATRLCGHVRSHLIAA